MKRALCVLIALTLCLAAWQACLSESVILSDEDQPSDLESRVEAISRRTVAGMTLREKICRLFIVAPEALTGESATTSVDDSFDALYAATPVGGIIYYAQNLLSVEQTRALIADIDVAAARCGVASPFHAVDEEGGSVARVAYRLGTTAFESAAAVGAKRDADGAYEMGRTMARELREIGFTVNFAPVADVKGAQDAYIGSRSFGGDAEMTAALASAMARGLQDNGVIAAMKHFPGHGSVKGNVHKNAVSDARAVESFMQSDFLPFQAGIAQGVGMVMMSDLTMRAVSTAPACLSREVVTDLLRGQLGFDGVVITDAMRMDAITEMYTAAEAAVLAIEAGCDMILLPDDLPSAIKALTRAVEDGRLSEERIDESLMRIMRLHVRFMLYD